MKVGYARVSTTGQSLEAQIDKLQAFGCERIYQEKQTGATSEREELKKALEFAREGDLFVITKLDRLARSVADLTQITKELQKKVVEFVVLDQNIDTSSPTGRLLFHMLGAIGEFERELILERANEGINRARASGVKFGRPQKLTGEKLEQFKEEWNNPPEGSSKADIAKKWGVSRASGYRINKEPIT